MRLEEHNVFHEAIDVPNQLRRGLQFSQRILLVRVVLINSYIGQVVGITGGHIFRGALNFGDSSSRLSRVVHSSA